jgi:hypothetical protein
LTTQIKLDKKFINFERTTATNTQTCVPGPGSTSKTKLLYKMLASTM